MIFRDSPCVAKTNETNNARKLKELMCRRRTTQAAPGFRIFCTLNLFDLEDTDLRPPKLHVIEIFNQATFHTTLVILASMRADLAGGTDSAPP